MNRLVVLAILMTLISLLRLSEVFGQAEGIPFHVGDPTSTSPEPPLREFLPSTNPYAPRLLTDQFKVVDDMQKIDPQVLTVFHSKVLARDIANRGERYNSTDVEVGPHLPFRRFERVVHFV